MGRPVSFGYKMTWLAIRSAEPARVIADLRVRGASPVSWEEGVDAVYSSSSMSEHPVFITPALDGWVLVASPGYFDEASDADPERLERFVSDAATQLRTEVQFFATHRAVEGHAWARADEDGLERAYFYLGETAECLLDVGTKTPHEETLECLDPSNDEVPDESTVMSVAHAWSLDPTGLDQHFPEVPEGYLGEIGEPSENDIGATPREAPRRRWWRFW